MWACAVGLQGEEEQEGTGSQEGDPRDLQVRAKSLHRQVTGRVLVTRVTRLTRYLQMMSDIPLECDRGHSFCP